VDLLEELIKRDEGLRLKPYRCTAGKLTIGYGRNLDENGITKEEALMLLRHDIQNSVAEAKANFSFYEKINETRKRVVLSMLFNMGLPTLRRFKKMLFALEHEDYEKASVEMLDSTWAKQVKSRAVELSTMMREG